MPRSTWSLWISIATSGRLTCAPQKQNQQQSLPSLTCTFHVMASLSSHWWLHANSSRHKNELILQQQMSMTTSRPLVLTRARNWKGESAVKTRKQPPHKADNAVTYLIKAILDHKHCNTRDGVKLYQRLMITQKNTPFPRMAELVKKCTVVPDTGVMLREADTIVQQIYQRASITIARR